MPLLIQQEGVRIRIPISPQRLVDQLAALTHTNLKEDASQVEVGVISQPTSKEGSSPVKMVHEVHHTQTTAKRAHPVHRTQHVQ